MRPAFRSAVRNGLLPSLAAALTLAPASFAQDEASTTPQEPLTIDQKIVSLFGWDSIGPANMSGRVTDLVVYENDPSIWYVATATGGLLKTTNKGVTFEHQFDQESTSSIGAVAVAPNNPDLVWVGTGEENPRNSVSYGDGVFKSTDGGETWTNMGLRESFQIGSIVVHPADENTVFVGALGRLYGPNEERGLYKTTDGGETWTKILHVDDETGVLQIALHPTNPDVMLVTTYERQRDGFDTNDPAKKWGDGSALWRSTDGGDSFEEVREGLPSGTLGRIGLHWYRKNPDVVYAIVESDKIGMAGEGLGYSGLRTSDAETGAKITRVADDSPAAKAGLKTDDIILSVGGEIVLSSDALQKRMAQTTVGETIELEIARGKEAMTMDVTLTEAPESDSRPYSANLGGQASNIQDLQGPNGHEHGGVYRSADAGQSWTRVNSINPRPMYFSQFRVDPSDETYQYVMGVSMARSKDGGKTFTNDASRGVHADQHAMWIDPNDGEHMVLGCDGGIYETFDRANTWRHLNTMALGQFYHVTVGPRRDYWVYGGLQDNGSWGAPRRSSRSGGPINEEWLRIGGGDGFVCRVDVNDPNQIYYESQNGGMGRTHLVTMDGGRIRPRAPRGTRYRFNWKTPFILSHHNSRIYYCAGNHVFRSLQKGDDLKQISPDITRTERGSATAIAESSRDSEVLYVGTDDGSLWMTKDGGANWTNLWEIEEEVTEISTEESSTEGRDERSFSFVDPSMMPAASLGELTGPHWVSSIETSKFETGRVYLTLDAHRDDDDNPYVFVSEDFGATWTSINGNLPRGSTRCVREDLENENLLYCGTEFGLYISLDRGQSWTRFHGDADLPTVPVHEVAQHALTGEIVAGTHGRSLWVCDVSQLRQMTRDALAQDAALFTPNDVVRWRRQHSRGNSGGTSRFSGENPNTTAEVVYRLVNDAAEVKLAIHDASGAEISVLEASAEAGVHAVTWNLRGKAGKIDPERLASLSERFGRERALRFLTRNTPPVDPGKYRVVLTVDGQVQDATFAVLSDPNFPESDGSAELVAEFQLWELEQGEEEEEGDDR